MINISMSNPKHRRFTPQNMGLNLSICESGCSSFTAVMVTLSIIAMMGLLILFFLL